MADEPHEVVKLLVARMESHPEEFERGLHRWSNTIADVTEFGNETDRAAMNAKLRDIRLGEAHEDMLDELLNGPERRRQQQEEIEYEQQLIMQRAMAQRNTTQMATAQRESLYDYDTQKFTTGSLTDTITQIGQMIRNKK